MCRPLVATNVPGCREVVRHGINGFLCRPGDSKDLADQMQTVLQMSVAQLEQLGLSSRKWVEQRFDEKLVIDAYTQLLSEMY
jgi:glycosyltransferase involved in cell wall biosynthesis